MGIRTGSVPVEITPELSQCAAKGGLYRYNGICTGTPGISGPKMLVLALNSNKLIQPKQQQIKHKDLIYNT